MHPSFHNIASALIVTQKYEQIVNTQDIALFHQN